MRQVRLQTRSKLADREDATETVNVATQSGLQVERQRQSMARVAVETEAAIKKGNLTQLLTKKQGQLETQKKDLEDANKKLSDTTVMQDRVLSRAAIETAAGAITTLESEIETLKQMLS